MKDVVEKMTEQGKKASKDTLQSTKGKSRTIAHSDLDQ